MAKNGLKDTLLDFLFVLCVIHVLRSNVDSFNGMFLSFWFEEQLMHFLIVGCHFLVQLC